jgi:hypothetical protein
VCPRYCMKRSIFLTDENEEETGSRHHQPNLPSALKLSSYVLHAADTVDQLCPGCMVCLEFISTMDACLTW